MEDHTQIELDSIIIARKEIKRIVLNIYVDQRVVVDEENSAIPNVSSTKDFPDGPRMCFRISHNNFVFHVSTNLDVFSTSSESSEV